MNGNGLGRLALGVALLGLSAGPAVGQQQPFGSRYNRMRTSTPSQYVGSVGSVGGFRTYTGPRASGRPAGVARLPSGYAGAGLGAVGAGELLLPAAVNRARTGVFSPSAATVYSMPALRTAGPRFLKNVSGYQRSMSLANPLTATQWNAIPRLSTPLYVAEEASSTSFNEYFGLAPHGVEERASASAPMESMAEAMKVQTSRRLEILAERATRLFQQATDPEVEDRDEKLAQVMGLCQAVLDVDRQVYLPYVLMLHTALERDQLLVASRALFGAVHRHPEVFVERPNIARYFEDPEQLDERERIRAADNRLKEQMREYLRVGDESPDEARAYAVQAYCAWVLQDRARVNHALERAEELSRGDPDHSFVRMLKTAMEAAGP